MKRLKFLLIPVTVALWVGVFYYGIIYLFVLTTYIFALDWITLVVVDTFFYGIVFAVAFTIPALVRLLLFKVYNENWFARILHSLAGLYAIVMAIMNYFLKLPKIYVADKGYFIVLGWWKIAPFKTVFVSIPAFVIAIWFIWAGLIIPLIPINEERF